MSLFDQKLTAHLRSTPIGRDEFNEPVYGDPTDLELPAWWEPAGSTEDLAAAEQYTERYWVYVEDPRITGADSVTLHGAVDLRCEVIGNPGLQPPGVLVGGFARLLVEAVTG